MRFLRELIISIVSQNKEMSRFQGSLLHRQARNFIARALLFALGLAAHSSTAEILGEPTCRESAPPVLLTAMPRLSTTGPSAVVTVEVVVGERGDVRGVRVLHGDIPALNTRAMAVALRWHFKPGTCASKRVTMQSTATIHFQHR